MDLIVPEVESVDTVLVINPDTRVINVGSGLLLGVETDNDAERVKFQCPKIVGDNLDLSQYHIYIHYQNAKGETGKYLCEDVEDAGENITFSWLLSQKVTVFKGITKFLVCAKKTDAETIVWNTTLASGNVLEGLAVDEDIVQQNDDVIEQILLRLERIEDSGGTGDINNAKVTFEEALERTNIESQETMSTIFGKIKKWFSDLKAVAFTGSYDDLLNKPDIPTKTSELTNDSDFLSAVPEEYVTDTELEEKGYIIESELPKKLPNPYKLKFTGGVVDEYDGSVEKTINIPTGSGGSEYTLPVATSTTLGGVKPVSKTSEMSQDVGVDENGKLYTVPGNGNDGLSVSYDEETQTLKFTSSSGRGSDLKNLLSNTVRYIEIDGEILEISNEKEWTVIIDELFTEDTQAIVKSNINFREIQVFVELQPSDAQKTIYLTSSSGGNIYGEPRVSINIANTYAGGICFLGIRVISPHMWELTRYLQPYKSGVNPQNKVHGTISKITNADFDKPEITGFTLISDNEDYPFKQGDRVTIIGR